MKKILIFSLIFVALFGFGALFSGHSASAWDSGCIGTGPFSVTTGMLCNSGYGSGSSYYSSTTTATNITTAAYNFTRELGSGSRGSDVIQLQQILAQQGYSVGRIDGVYGGNTRRAVVSYQRDHGLYASGIADNPTLDLLSLYYSPTVPVPPPCPLIYVNGLPTYSCNSYQAPSISSISGPVSLNVNQQGSWTVIASSANITGANLTYSVDWGDYPSYYYGATAPSSFQQSATFTHIYAQAGTYRPKFKVTNTLGQTAETTITVVVSYQNNYTYPSISSISPVSGPVNTSVTIYGSGFSSNGNSVKFGSGYINNIYSNGSQITFAVPEGMSPCPPQAQVCSMSFIQVVPGSYPVSVLNTNGSTSNSLNFTVTGSSSTAPSITSINPGAGQIGHLITIYGSNIDINAEIYMGGYRMQPVSGGSSQVSFYIPANLNSYCPFGTACTMQYVSTTPGNYSIQVRKGGLNSNAVTLQVY